jgi:RNA polymerase sigma-70 factor (ECF subfamily)
LARYSSTSNEEIIAVCAACNDAEAWEEFVSRFQRPIRQSILRIARERGEFSFEICEDLAQETFLKLCRDKCQLLLSFARQNPGEIEGYLRMVAINVARDHFKSIAAQRRGSGLVDQFPDRFEPGASTKSHGGQESAEQEILVREIGACLEKCLRPFDTRRDRTIFWLYYRDGWSAAAIAALPTVELAAKGVESAIARLTRLVRQEVVKVRVDST